MIHVATLLRVGVESELYTLNTHTAGELFMIHHSRYSTDDSFYVIRLTESATFVFLVLLGLRVGH